ncbi:MAG: SAM-dependent methyltransferase, partial [Roseiflexus sp.]
MESPGAIELPPSETPNAARIYSYTLGGSYYLPVDRAAAEYMFSLVPSTPKWVRMLRSFLQHAARRLWVEGLTHFIDFASGLPTDDHIHHVLPDARVVYSDLDLETYNLAQQPVGHLPNVLYLRR